MLMRIICQLLFCLCDLGCSNKQADNQKGLQTEIVFIVLSQPNDFHVQKAKEFEEDFKAQLFEVHNLDSHPRLYFSHSDFIEVLGAWTVFPLIEELYEIHKEKTFDWVFICEEDTRVRVHDLITFLGQYDASQNHFLGRGLRDQQATIIHHFAFSDKKFLYPDFGAGFIMSIALIDRLNKQLTTDKLKSDFSIDPKYELALYILNNGNGTRLTNLSQFCSAKMSSDPSCITTHPVRSPDCGEAVAPDHLFVAVKTCHQFHTTRVPIVKATWGKEATSIEYYSEVEDDSIPTIDLGVPNTERGHCGKTMAILQRLIQTRQLSSYDWLLIADDDTIINLNRLRSLLACYNPRQPVALGEKYGYGVARGGGYDYITGGGGMVFSQPAARLLSEKCGCYADDAPDDMTLGMCLKSIGIPITHSSHFHQSRPEDYSKEFLANQVPISFHKHWNTDPYEVYTRLIDHVHETGQASKADHSHEKEEL